MRRQLFSPVRQVFRVTVVGTLAVGLWVLWALRGPLFFENFAVLESGRVYRSAQPGNNLASWIRQNKLKSILSLRGGSQADGFYREESRVAREYGIELYQLPLSATERPKRRDLLRLVGILQNAPYPLLIHCKKGADRTGLASTVYRMVVLGESPGDARTAFSWERAHFPFFGTERLHEPINEYERYLRHMGLSHTPQRFQRWLESSYRDPGASLAGKPDGTDRNGRGSVQR